MEYLKEEFHNTRDCSGVDGSGWHYSGEDVRGNFTVRVSPLKRIDDLFQEIVAVVVAEGHMVEGVSERELFHVAESFIVRT